MKDCGILLPISSLPSEYGIGSFGKEAYKFVDFLSQAAHKYWQVLPLGQTSYGDSPYQTFSVNAGNPYFIDIPFLVSKGLLSKSDADAAKTPSGYINYGELYGKRYALLEKIKRDNLNAKEFEEFRLKNADWLRDYATFMALKRHHNDSCWSDWQPCYRMREEAALTKFVQENASLVEFFEILQYLFFTQWVSLKSYANEKGILIVGDMPIYVAYDSVDVWSSPELFYLDENREMIDVAGVPPDYFSADGQLWGNPLYNWEYMESSGFKWWLNRISAALSLYDAVRIDHFRGFDSYWAIPRDSINARNGEWRRGPALRLFQIVNSAMPNAKIIAEDLGEKSPDVIAMLNGTGYPGMKVLQFGLLGDDDNEHLPQNYTENYVAYTGTHDNATAKGWFYSLAKNQQDYVLEKFVKNNAVVPSMIDMVYASNANTVIIPMQDFLELGNEARLNIPSTLGGINWCWRLFKLPPKSLATKLRTLAQKHGRMV